MGENRFWFSSQALTLLSSNISKHSEWLGKTACDGEPFQAKSLDTHQTLQPPKGWGHRVLAISASLIFQEEKNPRLRCEEGLSKSQGHPSPWQPCSALSNTLTGCPPLLCCLRGNGPPQGFLMPKGREGVFIYLAEEDRYLLGPLLKVSKDFIFIILENERRHF